MFFDLTPSQMPSGQEWESPVGVAASLFKHLLLLWFWSFGFRRRSGV